MKKLFFSFIVIFFLGTIGFAEDRINVFDRVAVVSENYQKKQDDFSVNGTVELGMANTGIDNSTINGLPPDFSSEVFLNLRGQLRELNFKTRFELLQNTFDSVKLRRLNLHFDRENLLVELGNVRGNFSEFTLLNREALGILYSQTFVRGGIELTDEEKNNIRLQLLNIPLKRKENLEQLLERKMIQRPFFYRNTVTVIFGQTEKAVDVGDKIDFQNGRVAERPIFQQAGYGIRFESDVTSFFKMAVNMFAVEDDDKSLTRGIGPNEPVTPVSTKAVSFETFWKVFDDRWEVRTEAARNEYNPNRFLGASNKRRDNAFKLGFVGRTDVVDIDISLKRIEPDFYTGGNQGTLATNDRQGVFSIVQFRPSRVNRIRLRTDLFRDNLDGKLDQTSTDQLYEITWGISPPRWPALNLTARHNREASDEAPANFIVAKKNLTNFYGGSLSYAFQGISFSGFYSVTRFKDRNTYSASVIRSDFENRNLSFVVNAAPIRTLSIQARYNRTRSDFIFSSTRNVDRNGGIFISYDIWPDKVSASLEGNYGKTSSGSFDIKRRDWKVAADLIIGPQDKVLFELRKDKEDFSPDDNVREFNATVARIRYQRRF